MNRWCAPKHSLSRLYVLREQAAAWLEALLIMPQVVAPVTL